MEFTPEHREPLLNALSTSVRLGEAREKFLERVVRILKDPTDETIAATTKMFVEDKPFVPITLEEEKSFYNLIKGMTRSTRKRKE